MYIGLHTPLIANHSSTIFNSICQQVKLFKMHSNNMDIIFHSGHPYHFLMRNLSYEKQKKIRNNDF